MNCGTPAPLRFIDLFAGIGGLRLAFAANAGTRCVFASEIDPHARRTCEANFPKDSHALKGDLRAIPAEEIPAHDVLLAGPPCQPFSKAGIAKKATLGQPTGFADRTSGTLFFEMTRILAHHRPRAFLMENVPHLERHDQGRTFRLMRESLEKLGYRCSRVLLDARPWHPQKRKRLFMGGLLEADFSFEGLKTPDPQKGPKLKSILHAPGGTDPDHGRYAENGTPKERYTLKDRTWACLQAHRQKHEARGNGFGYTLCGPGDVARTLSARYGKDGSEILIGQPGKNPRRLTPRECARLMGFPDSFRIPASDTQAYRQFGNSVAQGPARKAALHLGKAIRP